MQPQPCVLLKYGEIALKGRNKHRFEHRLLTNLRHHLDRLGSPASVVHRRGIVVVTTAPERQDDLVALLRELIGVNVVQPALRVDKEPQAAAETAVELAREHAPGPRPSFAVRARRRDKRFPLRSAELAALIGRRMTDELGWPVDLGDPDLAVHVEVDQKEIFVSVERHRGQGGLPVGCSGRALVLLSGGFDSPVAAYRSMRRGLRCDFVHFTGAPLTGPASAYKAYALVHRLSRFQNRGTLHLIPFGRAQRALATSGAGDLTIVAQRRLMTRAAERLARRLYAGALVTGDSLGQVSSQTLQNLAVVEQAAGLPVLRPLLAFDKEEIVAEARRIGTYDISRLPDEDCCTLLAPPRVTTWARPGKLARLEERIDVDTAVDELLEGVQILRPPRTPAAG